MAEELKTAADDSFDESPNGRVLLAGGVFLFVAGAAVGAFGSCATTNGETVLVLAQIFFVEKLAVMVLFTNPGSPCSIRS